MNNLTGKDKSTLFFDVCAKIEGLCAELYHYYSDLFQENSEASQLWKKTALEEENHKRQFELANRLRDAAEFEIEADLERTYRIYQKLQNLLEHVRTNPPDIETALTKAIEMEEHLADLHMDSAVRFGNESIKEMFQSMRDFDKDHEKLLKHFLAIIKLPKADMLG
jgi:rubrerythrin